MATFVSTTLTRRTGATTTVFTPSTVQNDGSGVLYATGSLAGFGSYLNIKSARASNARRTTLRVGVPQLDSAGKVILYRPWAEVDLYIPDGTLQADVNDLVGYLNALTATGLTHANDILVNGAGVY